MWLFGEPRSDVDFSVLAIKPVLLVSLVVLSQIIISPESSFAVAASASSSATALNHNRFYGDSTLRKKSGDPYDDDFTQNGKGTSSSDLKRSRQREYDLDSDELERKGGASGHPLSTSAKESLIDYRDGTGCPPDFHGNCKCGYMYAQSNVKKKMFTVNCTGAGFASTQPLESLPENTEALIFTGNLLRSLPANIFGNTKTYPDLKYIDLSSNGIETILGKTFHRVNACETLILDNNMISRLTLQDHLRVFSNFVNLKNLHLSKAFAPNTDLLKELSEVFVESNLTQLEKLHLENNGIDYINEPEVFCELTSLLDLHLSQNSLADLNLNVSCLRKVRYVDLTYNKIRSVGENSGVWRLLHEKNLDGKQIHVNLWHNPFECDCKLEPFLELLHNWVRIDADLVPYYHGITCETGFPKNNTGLRLEDVTYTECPPLQASDYGSTAVSAVAWILGMMFLLGIGYFLYVNHSLLCRPVNPLHQTTTQGVKYTTIQEEEAEVAHV